MEKRKLTIIGGGPSGCSAAVYASRSQIDTLMITEDFGGQLMLTDTIENYLGLPGESGNSISEKFEKHVKEYDVDIKRQKVKKIEKEGGDFKIKTDEEEVVSEAVIIAVGTKPKKLGAPGEKEYLNKGVGYCAVCDGPLYQGDEVAVIGGGYSGTEAALFLSNIAEKVYLINAGEELSGEKITIEKIPEKENIEIINNAYTTEFYGNKFLEGLKYEDRETGEEKEKDVKAAFIEIGRTPKSGMLDFVEKTEEGKIKRDKHCRTSEKGFFASGDVSTITEEQAIVAAGDGCIAALQAGRYLKDEEK